MAKLNSASVGAPRSQRDLLAQLKSLVAASGNEKKFLLQYEALNIDKIGRTTVYDALHGRKIGSKLTVLLDTIEINQAGQALLESRKLNGGYVEPPKGQRSNRPLQRTKKTKVEKSVTLELKRPISAYVKQLQTLISASGSERKFFIDYARFNVAGAARSSVYAAVHDGRVRSGLAVMLDNIAGGSNA